jgi:hypothetical protein
VTERRRLHIVCAYRDGELGGSWFQAIRRARRAMERAGYDAGLELLPVSRLPIDADVVVADPTLARELRTGDARLLLTDVGAFGATLDALLADLEAAGRLHRGPGQARTIAVHRGVRAVGERARLED